MRGELLATPRAHSGFSSVELVLPPMRACVRKIEEHTIITVLLLVGLLQLFCSCLSAFPKFSKIP